MAAAPSWRDHSTTSVLPRHTGTQVKYRPPSPPRPAPPWPPPVRGGCPTRPVLRGTGAGGAGRGGARLGQVPESPANGDTGNKVSKDDLHHPRGIPPSSARHPSVIRAETALHDRTGPQQQQRAPTQRRGARCCCRHQPPAARWNRRP